MMSANCVDSHRSLFNLAFLLPFFLIVLYRQDYDVLRGQRFSHACPLVDCQRVQYDNFLTLRRSAIDAYAVGSGFS